MASSTDGSSGSSPSPPSKSASPVPPGATKEQPSPLIIGKAFIKQYYQVLSSDPSNIHRFYKPTSTLSHGLEASAPAPTVLLSDFDDAWKENVRSSPFAWTVPPESDPEDVLRFDFGRGAVDAQGSVSGGILLVASGRVVLPGSGGASRPFVHTFFLNNAAPAGKRKQFYVHNDVLRVLDDSAEEEAAEVADEAAEAKEETEADKEEVASPSANVTEEKEASEEEDKVEENAAVVSDEEAPQAPAEPATDEKPADVSTAAADDTADAHTTGEGETKEDSTDTEMDAVDDSKKDKEEVASTTPLSKGGDKGKGGGSGSKNYSRGSRGRGRGSRSSSPASKGGREPAEDLTEAAAAAAAAAAKPKVPGSWASLVAAGGSGGGSLPSSPVRAAKGKKQQSADGGDSKKDEEAPAVNGNKTEETSAGAGGSVANRGRGPRPPAPPQDKPQKQHGNPDATLIVKGIPTVVDPKDIRAMFEPYATRSKCPILNISIIGSRNFCYVDFERPDGPSAVLRDVAHKKKFMLGDHTLTVERKIDTSKFNKKGGGGNRPHGRHRSASPGGGHHSGGGGGGSGKGYRRPSPRNQRPGGGRGDGGGGRGNAGGAGGSSK